MFAMSNDTENEFEAPRNDPTVRNVHITHLEDLVFTHGQKGIFEAIDFLSNLKSMLCGGSHTLNISVKWDGSPSIVCGINPDNNRFFVATKSAFNVTPKLNYTDADIRQNHGNGVLAYILQQALLYLPELKMKNVLQGDVLFTHADLVDGVIEDVNYIMFKPNTIIYAVPQNTLLSQIISNAKIGIVFHTEYNGSSFATLSKSEWHDNGSLTRTPDVWFRDASFVDNHFNSFSDIEKLSFETLLTRMKQMASTINPKVINRFVTLDKLKFLTLRFTNAMIRARTIHKHNVGNYILWVEQQLNNEIIGGKTTQTKIKKTKDKDELLSFLRDNNAQLHLIFGLWELIVEAKHLVIAKFVIHDTKDNNIKMFLQNDDKLTMTNPEGFVVATKSGNTIKLVNRFEFAYHNFNKGRDNVI